MLIYRIRKRNILLIVILLIGLKSFSQEIKGKITDTSNSPLSGISIYIKASNNYPTILSYDVSDVKGNFRLDIPQSLNSFLIECVSLSYKKKTILINSTSEFSNEINIVLEENINILEEVVINAPKNHITQKKDTAIYDINKFMDGSEKVIEDIIKKLPGMKVDNQGRITYKGNPIKDILLDGDNLFDGNYTIATKNIDVDMVDKLAAIENYIQNPLLHGINDSQDVALNLILKKGKQDFSKKMYLGAGIENKLDLKSIGLGVSKKIKSFSSFSFNNIGKEDSPYNYIQGDKFMSSDKGYENTLNHIIQERSFISPLQNVQSVENSTFFGSTNWIYNLSEKLVAKLNFDIKKEDLLQQIVTQTRYNSNLNIEPINQSENLNKNPNIVNLKLRLNYKISNNKLFEYYFKYLDESIKTNNDIYINNVSQNSNLITNNNFSDHLATYTHRINNNSAYTSSFNINSENTKQNLKVTPDIQFSNAEEDASFNQIIQLKRHSIELYNAIILRRKNIDLEFSLMNLYNSQRLNSLLTLNDENYLDQNNLRYTTFYSEVNNKISLKINKWKFSTELKIRYLNQELDYKYFESDDNLSDFLFLPTFSIFYYINNKSHLKFSTQYNEDQIELQNTFRNIIAYSNRSNRKNELELETLKELNMALQYNYNNFFNLLNINSGIHYFKKFNNFIDEFLIEDEIVNNNTKLLNFSQENLSFNIGGDKYVNFLSSNLRFNFSYAYNEYKNFINNSTLRDNYSLDTYYEINLKTGFLGKVNLENQIIYRNSIFGNENLNSKFRNNALQNSFKLHLKPMKRTIITTSYNYYLPDMANNDEYSFLDFSIMLISKNGKINYSIISKNIGVRDGVYTKVDGSDFSQTITTYNLQRPFILFSLDFNF